MGGIIGSTLEWYTGNPGYITYGPVIDTSPGGTFELPVVVNTTGKALRGVVLDIQCPILHGLNYRPVGSVRGKPVSADLRAQVPFGVAPGKYPARLLMFYDVESPFSFRHGFISKANTYDVTINVK